MPTNEQKTNSQKLARYYVRRLKRRWHEATAPARMLPHFIVAGVPKCGTTALYRYLLAHPEVAAPTKNEIGFFSDKYGSGLNWYRAHFRWRAMNSRGADYSGAGIITGEHTPAYAIHPLAAERIAATLPHVRIIILLRDPVDRAYSHYQHEFRCGHESLEFRAALTAEPERIASETDRIRTQAGYRSSEYVRHAYLDQGKYRPMLERFFHFVDRSRVMVIKSERLFGDAQGVYDEVLSFLSLSPFRLSHFEQVNSGSYLPLRETDPAIDSELREYFRPLNKLLHPILGDGFEW
jgi:hypothetical protein